MISSPRTHCKRDQAACDLRLLQSGHRDFRKTSGGFARLIRRIQRFASPPDPHTSPSPDSSLLRSDFLYLCSRVVAERLWHHQHNPESGTSRCAICARTSSLRFAITTHCATSNGASSRPVRGGRLPGYGSGQDTLLALVKTGTTRRTPRNGTQRIPRPCVGPSWSCPLHG